MRFARNFLFVLVYFVLLLFGIPVLLVSMLLGARRIFLSYGRWMMRVGRDILGIHVETTGLDRLDPGTPFIFMANHASYLDGPLLVAALDRHVRVIVKRFVFRIPVLGQGMRFVGYVPLDKGVAGSGRERITRAARLMREKRYSFLVFPEGERSADGTVQRFHRGGFFLALETATPIVPVSIRGTHKLMPRGQKLIGSGIVRITFHEPIPVAGCTPDDMPRLMEQVRQTISLSL